MVDVLPSSQLSRPLYLHHILNHGLFYDDIYLQRFRDKHSVVITIHPPSQKEGKNHVEFVSNLDNQ